MTDTQHELLMFWLKGDEDAVRFVEDVYYVSQVIDDLVDRDEAVPADEVEKMAMLIFSSIPRNLFYRKHQDSLQSYLETALMYWIDGNKLETQGAHGRHLAFVFRDIIGGVAGKCALLLGGYEWWSLVSLDIHRRVSHDESFEDYDRGLGG